MASELSIQRIFLMMGAACNFHCRHCIQHPATMPAGGVAVSERVYRYVEHLAAIRPPEIGKLSLMFWGGEPLVYWDTIKAVVERLGGKANYSIISNGALLDDEKVEYLNAHGIHFCLSNDGPGTAKVRGCNMLEDEAFRERFLRLNNLSIDAIIHAHNQDYQALVEYLHERAPRVYINVEPLSCTWDMPADLYAFDFAKYRASVRKLCERAKKDIEGGEQTAEVSLVRGYADQIMRRINRELKGKPTPFLPRPVCTQVRHHINLDCEGNVYACHNFGDRLGTVEDDYYDLLARYDARFELPKECETCEALYFCRGGCPYSKGQPGKAATCEMARIRYEEALRFVDSFKDTLEPVEL